MGGIFFEIIRFVCYSYSSTIHHIVNFPKLLFCGFQSIFNIGFGCHLTNITKFEGKINKKIERKLTLTGVNNALSSPNDLANSPPFDVGKSHITILDPCWIRRSTVAFPRPEAPPVTNVTPP